MLLHVGNDVSVLLQKVVAVLSLEQRSPDTEEFIRSVKSNGKIIEVCPPPHKSCVVVKEKKATVLYMSGISAGTLGARAASGGLTEL